MGSRLQTSLIALLVGVGCTPQLKSGTDRADAGSVDAPRVDVGAAVDAPRDAPRPVTTQTSCPDAQDVGCGLVEIPGGTLTVGVLESIHTIDGSPEQPMITVGPVALDAYEVTVARFRRFWEVAASLPMLRSVTYPGGSVPLAEGPNEPVTTTLYANCNWTTTAGQREQHPINCIDWYTAQAFCAWDGGRLPTDAEWEFAARGREVGGLSAGRIYPWGDEDPLPRCDRARWNQDACAGEDGARTRRIGSFSPTPDLPGARLWDLAGNVYEWTADNFVDYSDSDHVGCWGALPAGRSNPVCNVAPRGARTLRGGSWFFTSVLVLRSASRFGVNEGGVTTGVGLPLYGAGVRCARTR
jgi:formylglycine-generating enzyme